MTMHGCPDCYCGDGRDWRDDDSVQAAIEVARTEARRAILAPLLDLIDWWETDGTDDRKAAAGRIRSVLGGAA